MTENEASENEETATETASEGTDNVQHADFNGPSAAPDGWVGPSAAPEGWNGPNAAPDGWDGPNAAPDGWNGPTAAADGWVGPGVVADGSDPAESEATGPEQDGNGAD